MFNASLKKSSASAANAQPSVDDLLITNLLMSYYNSSVNHKMCISPCDCFKERLFTSLKNLPVFCVVMSCFFSPSVPRPPFHREFTVGSFPASAAFSFLLLFIPVFLWTGSLSAGDLRSLWFSESKTYVPATRPSRKTLLRLRAMKTVVEFKATFVLNENFFFLI